MISPLYLSSLWSLVNQTKLYALYGNVANNFEITFWIWNTVRQKLKGMNIYRRRCRMAFIFGQHNLQHPSK